MSDADPVVVKLKERLRARLPHLDKETDIDMSAELVDFGLDSMVGIDLLVDLEKSFAMTFPDDLVSPETFRTGSSLAAAIRLALASAEQPR